MRRLQVVELEDLPYCPRVLRDGATDFLRFVAEQSRAFGALAPELSQALDHLGTDRIVDLCSGGGGPWRTLAPHLSAIHGRPVSVTLTDFYPNLEALAYAEQASQGRVGFLPTPVDATDVPADLPGLRTMFHAFHHFPPEVARRILADAVAKGRGIAIFDGDPRRVRSLLTVQLSGAACMAATPFIRPFRLSRLLLTYGVPLIPALVTFDGTMSMLRMYSEEELRELVEGIPGHERFTWRIGVRDLPGFPMGISHVIGLPP